MAEILIVAAIAAASAAATYTINYALTPKPKPVERGRLQGQVQVQDSSYGSMIPIIVGGEMPDGSAHGMRVAGNVIYMSDIRKHENPTSGTGGGGGKGGGGGGQAAGTTITYDADIGIMWGEGELELLALYAGTDLIFDNRVTSRTGIIDTTILPDDPYDYRFPPNPYDTALLEQQDLRYGATPVTNGTTGTTSAQIVAGAYSQLRFYSGTETQLVDPVIEADWGVDQTPAYLGRSYVMLEKFDLSRYNAVPNFTAILRNKNLKTVVQIVTHFASRSGYNTATEFDASALTQNVRGLAIVNRTSLQKLSSDTLAKVFPFDWTQKAGKLTAVSRGGAVTWAVPDKHLGFTAGGNETSSGDNSVPPSKFATKLELSETKLPRVIDVKAFDPNKDFEIGLSSYHREVVQSQLPRTEELNIVLTEDERRAVAQRLMEQAWLEEREICSFAVSHAYAAAVPTDIAQVTVVKDGVTTINTLRIKEITGSIPGPLNITGVPTRSALYITGGGTTPPATPKPVAIPGTVIGGFLDAGFLRDRDAYAGQLGVYVYATGVGNGDYKSAWAYRDRGAGFERMVELPEQAIAGRCQTTLDGSSTSLTVDLYRDAELDSYSSGEVSTGSGFVFAGNECLQYTTATPVVGFANRWTLTGLTNRGAKETGGSIATHSANERFVLLNTALRFIPLDLTEKGVAENWKFVALGMAVDDAATVAFTWLGSPPPTPTGLSLEQINESATSATIRGTFAFGSYSSSEQIGRVLIKRDGDADFRDSGQYPTPDVDNNGSFEIAGVTPGTHEVKVQAEFRELHSAPTAPEPITTTTSGTIPLTDTGLIIQNDADPTKQIQFDASGITPGATRTFIMPDNNTALVGATSSQTLTNKTLTAPVISSPTGLVKADVGLSNVDNTSDANKPVSTAQAAAIALKLSISSVDDDVLLAANSSSLVPTQHAVKNYIDNLVTGLSWKNSVRVATIANGTLATAFANGQVVDGVTLVTGNRILIKNQTTASENGIYVVAASGAPTRAIDADSGTELISATVLVREGATNADSQWTCTNDSITIGSTSIVFAQVSGSGTYTAGTGLTLTANSFSISAGAVTNAMLAGSIDLTSKVAGLLPIANGGTAAASASAARTNLGLGTGDSPTFAGVTLNGPISHTTGRITSAPTDSSANPVGVLIGGSTLTVSSAGTNSALAYFYNPTFALGANNLTNAAIVFVDPGGVVKTGAGVISKAASLFVAGAPTVGASNYAIYSESGNNFFGGNVGIGTTAPNTTLDVNNLHGGIVTLSTNSTAQGRLGVVDAANSWINGSVSGDMVVRSESGNLLFGTGGGLTLYLKSDGNVGIGTTTPGDKIESVGVGTGLRLNSNFAAESESATELSHISFYKHVGGGVESLKIYNIATFGVNSYYGSDLRFAFRPNTSDPLVDRVTFQANGNIGIGTTNPATSALLELSSTLGALLVTRMTTTQKNALTAINGMILYDSTLGKFQGYEAGAWANLI